MASRCSTFTLGQAAAGADFSSSTKASHAVVALFLTAGSISPGFTG